MRSADAGDGDQEQVAASPVAQQVQQQRLDPCLLGWSEHDRQEGLYGEAFVLSVEVAKHGLGPSGVTGPGLHPSRVGAVPAAALVAAGAFPRRLALILLALDPAALTVVSQSDLQNVAKDLAARPHPKDEKGRLNEEPPRLPVVQDVQG